MPTKRKTASTTPGIGVDGRGPEALLETATLQTAIANRANSCSSIGTDPQGVIRIFNPDAERMCGYPAVDRASELSLEFANPTAPAFEALAFKAARGVEDTYELTNYVRKQSVGRRC